jgi:UDP-N-acetylglucosamine/UDP-N-acetylgalactosamine diphosphorylase
MMTKNELLARLSPFGQEHVLAGWDSLSEIPRQKLSVQIASLDLSRLKEEFSAVHASENWADLAQRAVAPPAIQLSGHGNPFTASQARITSEQALTRGEVGVILVAGGQGTRLGFDRPKGMYAIGPVSGATLFQMHFEGVLARSRKCGKRIPIAVMTSPATDEETRVYLTEQNYFGVPAEDVFVFCQGTMPAVDAKSGKLLLASPDSLALSPDGHGGMLAALAASGTLHEFAHRGIRHVFYLQIDNPLVSVADPTFVGYHILAKSEVSTQVIRKQTPREKVGNVVLIDGTLRIIEYSDLNPLADELVTRQDQEGMPIFWAGSIAVHLFALDFLGRVAGDAHGLPFHIAKKAVPFIDSKGNIVRPDQPNAIKFERFIFDLLPSAKQGIVVEIAEERGFAPLKNGPGEAKDTPEYVQTLLMAEHRRWLRANGVIIADDVPIEISPLFAQDESDLIAKLPPKTTIASATYLR